MTVSKSEAVKRGLRERYPDGRRGEAASRWKGGRRERNGYVEVYSPDHPRAGGRPYVFEHILVAERTLGRHLGLDEVVHHVNHVKDDNRPENLIVKKRGEHVTDHFAEAVELIALVETLRSRIRDLKNLLDEHGIDY